MTTPKLSPAELAQALKRERGLIGVTAAARRLGIAASNFKRDMGLLPGMEPRLTEIPVEGSAAVFLRSEVERVARQRSRARSNGHH